MRYKPKNRVSPHAERRFAQRYDGDRQNAEHLANGALHYGIQIHQIPQENPLHAYVSNKMRYKDKKVRLLQGYVFVFSKAQRLITLYRIPEELREHYSALIPIEEGNRAKWRLHRKG